MEVQEAPLCALDTLGTVTPHSRAETLHSPHIDALNGGQAEHSSSSGPRYFQGRGRPRAVRRDGMFKSYPWLCIPKLAKAGWNSSSPLGLKIPLPQGRGTEGEFNDPLPGKPTGIFIMSQHDLHEKSGAVAVVFNLNSDNCFYRPPGKKESTKLVVQVHLCTAIGEAHGWIEFWAIQKS